jgi:hypothetical protein
MHRAKITFSRLAGANRGMHSKQFVTELHDKGFTRDQAIEMLCLVFGVPHGAAKLFIVSHPAWAAETAAHDSDRSIGLRGYGGVRRDEG